MDRIWKMSILITVIILSDQFTKGLIQQGFMLGESRPIIDGFFNFTYVRNPGAAFGIGRDSSDFIRGLFFLFIPVLACFWMIFLIWKERAGNFLLCLAYSLIFAGAVGNLIDRFSLGYVVDFLDFYVGTSHFPAFNIADSSISIAAGLLIIDYIIQYKNEKAAKSVAEESTLP
jgi:signal peptidase II